MSICAILTGRGGSTLKDKNIIKVKNRPILSYPCKAALKIKKINNFFVSSDDKKILDTAFKYGYKKILRPKVLSTNNAKHEDVLKHSISKLNELGLKPKIIIVLLANAPIIKSKWISESIKILENSNATAVVPVIKDNDKHPFRSKKIKSGNLKSFFKFKKKISSNRQNLEDSYFLCHNFWAIKTSAILKNEGEAPWTFMGDRVKPYIIKKSMDVHERFDLKVINLLIEEENIK